MESTLSTPCSRSDPPLSCQGAALAHLESLSPHNVVLWTDGTVPFDKAAPAYLPTALSVTPRLLFLFQQRPVCLNLEAHAIVHALCWSRQDQQVRLFSFCPLLLFYLPQTLCQELSSFFFCSIRLQWVPGHSFLPGNDAADQPGSQSRSTPTSSPPPK